MEIDFPIKTKSNILALGAESSGNFSVYSKGKKLYFSEDFRDLLDEKNWIRYRKDVLAYLKNNKIKPSIVLTDLHPIYKTTAWGKELSKKYKAKHIQIQHHIAHIFSAVGDKITHTAPYATPDTFHGIACDGTGYGLDGKIWGGEILQLATRLPRRQAGNSQLEITRVGHLENQILIGGDLAIQEPARMLISILYKVFSVSSSSPSGGGCHVLMTGEGATDLDKNKIYNFVRKHYSRNEFELLYNQLQQNFNCQETSSTGRVLDAISLLLGFCGNKRNYKHEPIDLLEKSSSRPYTDLKPKIIKIEDLGTGYQNYTLDTTYLFNYVINYLHKDKKRLAATAQLYIAEGLYEIIKSACHPERSPYSDEVEGSANQYHKQYYLENSSTSTPSSGFAQNNVFFAGGLANNKVISTFLESKNIYTNKKTCPAKSLPGHEDFCGVPRGDAGLSFGQIVYYLLSK